MLVDDEAPLRRGLRRTLEHEGHHVSEAASASEARRSLDAGGVDVVVIDLGLPDEHGLNLLQHASIREGHVAAVVLTASRERANMKLALAGGATSYLVKSSDTLAVEAQIEAALRRLRAERAAAAESDHAQRSLALVSSRWQALPRDIAHGLSHAWDLRHVETGAHVRRIGLFAEVLATALGMPAAEASELGEVAILHDLGKLAIPDAILTKPGRLTPGELVIMRKHAREGARMLAGIGHPFFERAASVALGHHERWDGSGYPDGLIGTACPLDARIVGVADVYDALATARCYKPAWEDARIEAYFREAAGKQFEARLAHALLELLPTLKELGQSFPDSPDASAVFPSAAPHSPTSLAESSKTG